MKSTETGWHNVVERGRVGTIIEVLCVCVYICMGMYTGRKATSSQAVSALIPDRVKWRVFLVPSSPTEVFRV